MRTLISLCFSLLFLFGPMGVTPAWANGIDLPQRSGNPGDQLTVAGHHWLTCCPANTPVERVRLYLIVDGERIQLFEVAANSGGEIAATFTVPDVPPGTYALEACSDDPQANWICLPEGEFTVGLPLTGLTTWPVPLGAAVALMGLGLLAMSMSIAPADNNQDPASP